MTVTTSATMIIVLNTARTQGQLAAYIKDKTDSRGQCRVLGHFFDRLKSGVESASFTVATSANPPIAAAGTVTVVNGSVVANDTLTIAGTVFTAKTSGATGAQFNIGGTGTITATNIAAAINANQNIVTATSAAAVVTVTCNTPGLVGNFVPMATSHTAAFTLSAATLASGAGGAETSPVLYNKGR